MFRFLGMSNRSEVEIERLRSPLKEAATVSAIVSVYRKVFGDDPWYEAHVCPVCSTTYGRKHVSKLCEACEPEHSILLIDHWPTSVVLQDFYREMLKSKARCVIAKSEEGLVGFAWGYEVEMSPETSSHLKAPGLHQRLHGTYFYIDEVAVLLEYRGKGIGKSLVAKLTEGYGQNGIVLRTLANCPMQKLIESSGGMAIQNISEGRIIMVA